jgi:hypothetical protein
MPKEKEEAVIDGLKADGCSAVGFCVDGSLLGFQINKPIPKNIVGYSGIDDPMALFIVREHLRTKGDRK